MSQAIDILDNSCTNCTASAVCTHYIKTQKLIISPLINTILNDDMYARISSTNSFEIYNNIGKILANYCSSYRPRIHNDVISK